MLSKILEVQSKETEIKPGRRSPTSFRKSGKKRPLSKQVQEGTIAALKEMLAKQKENTQMSAAGPFQGHSSLSASADLAKSLAIDPSAQVTQLYEKLCDKLLHLQRNGIQETTLFLDGNAFSSSAFEGAKITIVEYSTAPKMFNIEFTADPRALTLFEAHAQSLINAFNQSQYGFTINRIDTSLLTEDEKHAFKPVKREDEEKDPHS